MFATPQLHLSDLPSSLIDDLFIEAGEVDEGKLNI